MKLLTLFLVLAAALSGQTSSGVILGSVADSSGGAVPGVAISIVNTATGETRTAKSDASGNYLAPALPVGTYRVEAELGGFKKFIREGIVIEVNRNARVDVVLQVGQVTDSVVITGDVPLVDTYQAQMGSLVDSRRVTDLPLSGRNVYQLATMLPGVTAASVETVFTRNGSTLQVNGSRSRHSSFMLDGGFNNSNWRNAGNAAPNPDAVQEFRVITNNYNAEYGRSSGAVVNVVTRSGSNELHGTLFEFLRNNRLNAHNFFNPVVDPLRQNQYGASVGGPIRRNKAFFFGSWENLNIRSSQFINSGRTPTVAERAGDFSAAAARQQPLDPLTNTLFPNAQIPRSRFDPVAASIIEKVVPPPTTADGRLEASRPTTADQHQALGKGDYLISSKHKLFGSFFFANNRRFNPFNGGTQVTTYGEYTEDYKQFNVVAAENWIISPSALNEFRFTYTRQFYDNPPVSKLFWSDFGSKIPLAASFHKPFPPSIRISGRWQMGTENDNEGQRDDVFAFNDNLSYTRGAHNLKFGVWYGFERYNALLALAGAGILTVGGEFTNNALADFMLGRASSIRQTSGTLRSFRKWDWQTFVQDDWKIHKRVTLNLGLRYELYPRWYSLRKDLQTFRPGVQSTVIPGAPIGLQFEGDPGIPRSMAPLDKNNFAPRLGLAIDPFGDGKTAIRAGYGIFYTTPYADAATYLQQQPFQTDLTIFGITTLVDPYARYGGSPFPAKVDPNNPLFTKPILGSWMDANLATPYVQQFSLAIQRQITATLALQAAYVGNTSRKLITQVDANQPTFIPSASTPSNVDARRPILPGTYGQISKTDSGANAHYDSFQLTADKRFARGFSVLFNYTLSKNIDEASDDPMNPTDVRLVNSFNRQYDRALADLDVRHIANVSYLWDLPTPGGIPRWSRQVIGGWQLNGFVSLRSGPAVNVTAGRDVNLDGRGNDRANVIGYSALAGDRSRDSQLLKWFNTAAFELPATGTYGTVGRNTLRGPGSWNWNFTTFKNFRIFEGHKVQFRAEFFSFLNHPQFGAPTGNVGSASFGRILSAGGARVTQFGLKYQF